MVEYIDRAKLIAEYDRVHIGPAGGARKLMVDAPTADVVEVVRCKDCSHYIEMKGFDYNGRKARSCVWHSALRGENDYCSDGIRRTSQKEVNDMTEHTKEEIMKALECCQVTKDNECKDCPYYNESDNYLDCISKMCVDALTLIKAGE